MNPGSNLAAYTILFEPRFHDPIAALEHVEKLLWPERPL